MKFPVNYLLPIHEKRVICCNTPVTPGYDDQRQRFSTGRVNHIPDASHLSVGRFSWLKATIRKHKP
jgi:hypothetical protein